MQKSTSNLWEIVYNLVQWFCERNELCDKSSAFENNAFSIHTSHLLISLQKLLVIITVRGMLSYRVCVLFFRRCCLAYKLISIYEGTHFTTLLSAHINIIFKSEWADLMNLKICGLEFWWLLMLSFVFSPNFKDKIIIIHK